MMMVMWGMCSRTVCMRLLRKLMFDNVDSHSLCRGLHPMLLYISCYASLHQTCPCPSVQSPSPNIHKEPKKNSKWVSIYKTEE